MNLNNLKINYKSVKNIQANYKPKISYTKPK